MHRLIRRILGHRTGNWPRLLGQMDHHRYYLVLLLSFHYSLFAVRDYIFLYSVTADRMQWLGLAF